MSYESRSLELRKHLTNAIGYMKHDRTNFALPITVSFLEGYLDGLEEQDKKEYDSWLKDQQENADLNHGYDIKSTSNVG